MMTFRKTFSSLAFTLVFAANAVPTQASDASISGWQTFGEASGPMTIQCPPGWKATTDPKTGRIDVVNDSGAALSILSFFVANQTVESIQPKQFFQLFVKMFAPNETWTEPQPIGTNAFRATYTNSSGSGSAALVLQPSAKGISGQVCVAKVAKGAQNVGADTFATIMSSIKYNAPQSGSKELDQSVAQGNESASAAFTKFTDPSENSFTVDVPAGWKVDGGLTRYGALDVRPWVRAVSPDGLVTAFIGDGKISPCTMPTGTLSALGFRVGSNYNGSLIQPYMPARQFAESYAKMNLKPFLSNIQVVEEHDHPDVAAAVNGTVGATRSEAASIKLTGMYGDIPAVAYYLAVTKATVASGTGMWWVTKVAGSVGPAARDGECLGVILHMLQSFEVNPAWASNSLRNTTAVSQHYRQVSQQVSQSISNRYWSQQAHNDRMNQSYWNRQASQDRAANNFSNYIRGVENVQDPSTGAKYQVQYGPQYHYIDSGSNYITGGDHGAPGPEWRQLISVP
ncbi:MAG: hypothetical protein IT342_23180 [Candidatus Melainabacteria bacterium]|nr:hypothetical protein [Candidatus Melainabacteria bacterium]